MPDKIEVKVVIVLPDLPQRRGPDTRVLTPPVPAPEPDVRLTRLPVQPDDTPSGYVWAGANFGLVPYSGVKPQPGDLIAVVGNRAQRYVTSPLATEAQRWPTFNGGCKCVCPDPAGTAAVLSQVAGVAQVLLIDAMTADLRQIVGAAELGFQAITGAAGGPAIAFDTVEPWDLYVLDDLRIYQHWVTDQQTTRGRAYFRLTRWRATAGQYAVLDRYDITDPYAPSLSDPIQPLDEPLPPAVHAGGSCLAVHDGVVTITIANSPARYLRVTGMATQTTVTLMRPNIPYARALRGNLVQVIQKPGRGAERFVLARQGAGETTQFELLRVSAQDVVTGVVALGTFDLSVSTPVAPIQVAAACNQLLVLVGQVSQENIGTG